MDTPHPRPGEASQGATDTPLVAGSSSTQQQSQQQAQPAAQQAASVEVPPQQSLAQAQASSMAAAAASATQPAVFASSNLPTGIAAATSTAAALLSSISSPMSTSSPSPSISSSSSIRLSSSSMASASPSATSQNDGNGNGIHFSITWLIPVFVVLGLLLLLTIIGKCWGLASLSADHRRDERRRAALARAGSMRDANRQMSQINYETHGTDFFLGKSGQMDDRYTTRHAPVRGPYYNYGGGNGWARDVPTTRTRAGRFEAPVQKNSWWKLKFQGAIGSSEPDRSQFAAVSRGSFDAASVDSRDEGSPSDKGFWGRRLSRQRSFSPTSYDRRHMTVLDKAADSATSLATAIKSGPGGIMSWLTGSAEARNTGDESIHLLDMSGSPVKANGADELPAFHSPRSSPKKQKRLDSPVILAAVNDLQRPAPSHIPSLPKDDDGFIDSPLSSPTKRNMQSRGGPASPLRQNSQHSDVFGDFNAALPSACSSPSRYTCASWGNSAITASPAFGENGQLASITSATWLTRQNTMANSEFSAANASAPVSRKPTSALAKSATRSASKKRKQSVRIHDRVDDIAEALKDAGEVKDQVTLPASKARLSRSKTVKVSATIEKSESSSSLRRASTTVGVLKNAPEVDVFGTVNLQRHATQSSTYSQMTEASADSSKTHSSVSSGATVVGNECEGQEVKNVVRVTPADMRKINSFATDIMAMVSTLDDDAGRLDQSGALELTMPGGNDDDESSLPPPDVTPRRQGTWLRVGGRWRKDDEASDDVRSEPQSPPISPQRALSPPPLPLPPTVMPAALAVASPIAASSPSVKNILVLSSPAKNRSSDLFLTSPVTTYHDSNPPRRRHAESGDGSPVRKAFSATDQNQPQRTKSTLTRSHSLASGKTFSTLSGSTVIGVDEETTKVGGMVHSYTSPALQENIASPVKRAVTRKYPQKHVRSPAQKSREQETALRKVQALVADRIDIGQVVTF